MSDGAVIVDRGYRSYDEERLGRRGAVRAIVREGFRQVLGLRRKARRKVLPWMLVAFTVITVAVIIGISWAAGVAAGPLDPDIPSYGEYFDMTSVISLLFMAVAAPQLLIPDRTESVLNVYLSRPLGMRDYLVGKLGALTLLGMAFFLVPQTIMHFGLAALSRNGFISYLSDNLDVLWKVPATAVVYYLVHASLAVGAAALIPRIGFAAGIFLGGMGFSNGVAEFVTSLNLPGARYGAFLAFEQLPRVVRDWIFDIRTANYVLLREGFEPWTALIAMALLVAACAGIIWLQYRRLP